MQMVSKRNNLHEMSNPIFREKIFLYSAFFPRSSVCNNNALLPLVNNE